MLPLEPRERICGDASSLCFSAVHPPGVILGQAAEQCKFRPIYQMWLCALPHASLILLGVIPANILLKNCGSIWKAMSYATTNDQAIEPLVDRCNISMDQRPRLVFPAQLSRG